MTRPVTGASPAADDAADAAGWMTAPAALEAKGTVGMLNDPGPENMCRVELFPAGFAGSPSLVSSFSAEAAWGGLMFS